MNLDAHKTIIKRLLVQAGQPYAMGYDCGINGPNTTNCHFGLFSSPENTKEWERGKAAGDAAKRSADKAFPPLETK